MGQIQINGGRRWAEDRFVPNTFLTYELPDEPTDICLQLGEEDLILPGLLDMHTHLWRRPPFPPLALRRRNTTPRDLSGRWTPEPMA